MHNKGKEFVGWEILSTGKVVGLKFFTINYIDDKYILASFEDFRGRHQKKFSAKTGIEWRHKPWDSYYHLTKQEVKR